MKSASEAPSIRVAYHWTELDISTDYNLFEKAIQHTRSKEAIITEASAGYARGNAPSGQAIRAHANNVSGYRLGIESRDI